MTPADVTPESGRKVWWKCQSGHEWQATVASEASTLINTLTTSSRECFAENLKDKKPEFRNSTRRQQNAGKLNRPARPRHQVVSSRDEIGKSSILSRYPELAREWHPTKNRSLTPAKAPGRSRKMIWWQCSNLHEWQESPHRRLVRGTYCPLCPERKDSQRSDTANVMGANGSDDLKSANYTDKIRTSISEFYPELVFEWHPTRNGDLTPANARSGSKIVVWWQCRKSHEWQASPHSRIKMGQGCPYCLNRDGKLFPVLPQIEREWYEEPDGKETTVVTPTSRKILLLRCSKGHTWRSSARERKPWWLRRCPSCAADQTV